MKFSGIMKIVLAISVVALAMFFAFGCGEDGPEDVVKSFLEAGKDKDCEAMVDLMDLSIDEAMAEELGIDTADFKDQMIEACKADAETGGEIVDYEIGEATIDGDTAEVEASVTTEIDGEESTEEDTLKLIKVDGDWKITLGL